MRSIPGKAMLKYQISFSISVASFNRCALLACVAISGSPQSINSRVQATALLWLLHPGL